MTGKKLHIRRLIAKGLLGIFVVSFIPNFLHNHPEIHRESSKLEIHSHSEIIDECDECQINPFLTTGEDYKYLDLSMSCDLCDFTFKKTFLSSLTAINILDHHPIAKFVLRGTENIKDRIQLNPHNKGSPTTSV